jgi:hypothetical protein
METSKKCSDASVSHYGARNIRFQRKQSLMIFGKRSLGRPLKRWSETVTSHLA